MARATVMVLAAAVMVLAAALAVLLLASASVARAARSLLAEAAASGAVSPPPHQTKAVEGWCEGATDEDECMARRTLAAHTDYIYTQEHHN